MLSSIGITEIMEMNENLKPSICATIAHEYYWKNLITVKGRLQVFEAK